MSLLQYTQKLFSLDTLDTRFTASAKRAPSIPLLPDPIKPSPSINGDGSIRAHGAAASPRSVGGSPSKWRTPEFYFYLVFVGVCLLLMLNTGMEVSKPSHPNYPKYEHLLEPGWILGRKVDNSDAQYSSFRDNFPAMAALVVVHPLLRRIYEYLASPKSLSSPGESAKDSSLSPWRAADLRLRRRVNFDLFFSCIFLVALTGTSSLKIMLILYTNFLIATRLPLRQVPAATWVFNVGILFANELCRGYRYADLERLLFLPSLGDEKGASSSWGAKLDGYGGLLSRWEVLFKLTILRLVSFNFDCYWGAGRETAGHIEKKRRDLSKLSERDRVETPPSPYDFSLRNYLAYTLYAPLYIAGPILTFNDYIHQQRFPPPSITAQRTLLYGIRLLISFLCMELMLHYIYAVAISKAHPAWEIYTPFQVSMLGYFNLHIIWLKLLLPWRFFRLWALMDGVDPPENMVRCVSDNYSTLAFWRNWHRSFNRWTLRYIYIPLGGSGSGSAATNGAWGKAVGVRNMLVVFSFVAMWHDINLRLLMWGWLITLFVLPEVLAGLAFPKKKWEGRQTAYRMICGVGAAGNILMMMAANLVGFAVGWDGLKGMVGELVGSWSGIVYMCGACTALFVGSQVMFEVREHEMRQGIHMKC